MNGKKGSYEIDIPTISTVDGKQPESRSKSGGGDCGGEGSTPSFKGWMWSVWKFGKEDSNRVKFSLKVGLAVLLVSLLILFRAPYQVFGTNIIWSILTVAIMFEYTVGATFNRGFNRALGSVLAGILGIVIAQLALSAGRVVEPYIIGVSIFLIGAITSFMKLWPSLVQYEYGFRVILFTYCLIIVSGYRMGNPVRTAMDRLYSIALGGIVAVLVNVLVFPIWSGEQLHNELVNSFDSVADSLEECVKKYMEDSSDYPEFTKNVMDEFPDEPAYSRCRKILNSSASLESLAIAAKWEPPHGNFKHFFYPWSEYVKVGAVLRYCAYEVMALHGVLHSEIQAPYNLRVTFEREIKEASSQAAELVRCLGKDMSSMKQSMKSSLLMKVHTSTERLQYAIDRHSYLFTCHPDPPQSAAPPADASSASSKPLPPKAQQLLSLSLSRAASESEQQLNDKDDDDDDDPARTTGQEMTMRRQMKRLHSWPSREVDVLEEEQQSCSCSCMPRMRALDSTAALSLATFTSLLIEFVARLDHLVEAVDRLALMAKFPIIN